MSSRLFLGSLLLALWPLAPAGAQELTVQRTWRLAAIGLEADARLDVRRVLEICERGFARELPGLEITFDVERYRSYRLPAGFDRRTLTTNHDVVQQALKLAEADGLDVAGYDVVFVLTPLATDELFGLSHIPYTDRRGREARGALIHSAPFSVLHRGVVDALQERYPPGFYPPQRQPLPEGVRSLLVSLLRLLRIPLKVLCELPFVREALLAPTIAHELGHFFAPGDLNVRDGYQEAWLSHSTGPNDNPDGHALECVMYKGRDARFYVEKALAIRGRLVVFCDGCREKLGTQWVRSPPPSNAGVSGVTRGRSPLVAAA